MPELPDLEVVKEVLQDRVIGLPVVSVEVLEPLVLRCSIEDLKNLAGNRLVAITRRGKFLLFRFETNAVLVIHAMLFGRYQLCRQNEKPKPRTCLRFRFANDQELRYVDSSLMGKIYLVHGGDFSPIPQFNEMGPEPLQGDLTLPVFRQRLRKHRGMIKNVLTNQKFLAGIGNTYADEILFAAKILPFRQRTSLTEAETQALYDATQTVLAQAIATIRQRIGTDIYTELRDFLQVHNKGDEPCPVCGGKISEIKPNQRITNFCRACQK